MQRVLLSLALLLLGAAEGPGMLQVVQSVQRMVDADEVFQESTIKALLEGTFDGVVSMEELARHGDFGLGTFHALEGELVALDGRFYQVRDDGVATPVRPEQTTPFAVVKFFQTDYVGELEGDLDLASITAALDAMLPDPALCYAVKVHGFFDLVEARAIQPVAPPYPPLGEASQSEFSRQEVAGTLVGFRFPPVAQGLNVPDPPKPRGRGKPLQGYHVHFLSDDGTFGGHVFAVKTRRVTLEVDDASLVHLALPPGVEHPEGLSDESEQRRPAP